MSTIANSSFTADEQNVIDIEIPPPTMSKGEREYRAFLRLLPELLQQYPGKWVAIHEDEVIDNDENDIALIQRVYSCIGQVPIHVGLVVFPQPVYRL